jgi:HSP20 family molecular chaperone IbpA
MNKRILKRFLITIGLLGVIGAVGAQTYYTKKLAERVAAQESVQLPEATISSSPDRWDPWNVMHDDMRRMRAQMDQWFSTAFRGIPTTGFGRTDAGAKVTVEEQGDNYVVKADFPNAKERDIKVNLDGRQLSISSQTHSGDKQTADNGQMIRQERYASSFQQVFTLPGPVNASGMHTKFQDGVLTVTIPQVAS